MPNTKPFEKSLVSHYEVYRGKNGDHHIEVSNSGKKRFYITKDTPTGTPHASSTDTGRGIGTYLESPSGIIPPIYPDYNPQSSNNGLLYGSVEMNINNSQKSDFAGYANPLTGNNRIFTREEVGAMTKDEFARNEKEIMAQIKAMGGAMPSMREPVRSLPALACD